MSKATSTERKQRDTISPINRPTKRTSTQPKIDRKAKKRGTKKPTKPNNTATKQGTRTTTHSKQQKHASTQTEDALTRRKPTSAVAATPKITNDRKCAIAIEQDLIRHLRYIFTNYSQPPLQPHAVIAGVNEAYAQLIGTAKQRGLSAVPAVVSEFFRELELIYPIGQLGEATKQAGLNPIDHLITEPIDELARNGQIPPQDSTVQQALPSLATDGLFKYTMPQDGKYNTGQIERAALAGEGSGEFSLETDLTSTIAMSQ
jgi:hypothetical protein